MANTTDPASVVTTQQFLSGFMFEGGLIQLSVADVSNAQYYPVAPELRGEAPKDKHVFFGPAMRARKDGHKESVLGTLWLWSDSDGTTDLVNTVLAPTAVVMSGHGNHYYWKLNEPLIDREEIEALNKVVMSDIPTADGNCFNCNRLMRVPGTWNPPDAKKGETEPIKAFIRQYDANVWYTVEDIRALAALGERARLLIKTGDQEGYESRSDRDWAAIRWLVVAGASDRLIEHIFRSQPIGDKYREADGTGYLQRSVAKMRAQLEVDPPEEASQGPSSTKDERPPTKVKAASKQKGQQLPVHIVEKPDGYYAVGNSSRRISTFTLDPQVLLQGVEFGAQDAIVATVKAGADEWPNVTFPRAAFNSVPNMDKACPIASWQWLGSEADLRSLLPYLMDKLRAKDFPKVAATPMLGLHKIKERWLFLGQDQTTSASELWNGAEGPLAWLPSGKLHPNIALGGEVTDGDLARLASLLPQVNQEASIWSLLGWYAAAAAKPWLESKGYRFPILNITGTKGSGKTTLRQRVIMPLFGQHGPEGPESEPTAYDAGTTKFVRLMLMGSSNAIPIAFSEFRYERVEQFIGMVLLAYDTGHDPRGRADQTAQDYPLSAPVSVDGEDVIQDAAARERIILVRLRPDTIAEGTLAHNAFSKLRSEIPSGFGGYFIRKLLAAIDDGSASRILAEAKGALLTAFPNTLPDRVRNNYTVCYFGCLMLAGVLGTKVPSAAIFREAIGEVIDFNTGRSTSLVDEYVEAIVNAAHQYSHAAFAWHYNPKSNVLFFQMSSAHGWWLAQRKRQGGNTLQRDALIAQLREAPYSTGVAAINGVPMYGIDLEKATEAGLDVPSRLAAIPNMTAFQPINN